MQDHRDRIFLVGQCDDGLCSSLHSLLFTGLEIQIGGHVSIGMGYCQGRLKEILGTRGSINLMSTLADRSIRSCIHIPFQLIIIRGIKQSVAQIHLIKSPLGRDPQDKICLFCRHTDCLLRKGRTYRHTGCGKHKDCSSH